MKKNKMRIEAKPNTELRSRILSAFFRKGFAGPNYNLDDISAYVSEYENRLELDFWDMSTTIDKMDASYAEIKEVIKHQKE